MQMAWVTALSLQWPPDQGPVRLADVDTSRQDVKTADGRV
jgi:hypothetical protein